MNNTIYWVHGDIGGAGKSTVANVLIDMHIKAGKPIFVIEGDANRDVMTRHIKVIPDYMAFLNMAPRSSAGDPIIKLGEMLKQSAQGRDVIVNLPATASQTIDQTMARVLVKAAAAQGFDTRVIFSLKPSAESLAAFTTSARSGLIANTPHGNTMALIQRAFGAPERFEYFGSDIRDELIRSGKIIEGVMPDFDPASGFLELQNTPGNYSEIAENPPSDSFVWYMVGPWLEDAHAALQPIIANHSGGAEMGAVVPMPRKGKAS